MITAFDVNFAIVVILTNFAFDVKRNVEIDANTVIVVNIANSFDVIFESSFNVIFAISSANLIFHSEVMSFRTMITKMFISSNLLSSRT